jgi:hypothetical protein
MARLTEIRDVLAGLVAIARVEDSPVDEAPGPASPPPMPDREPEASQSKTAPPGPEL